MDQVVTKNVKTTSEVSAGEVTGKEMFGHAIAGVGQNFIFAFWSSYMMMFYTDVFGLSAAFVGMLFFGARAWDAINDPMMGVIADKTRTKWGRFRPWLLIMPIPVGICLVLNFTVPNVTGTAAMIYAAVTYILMSMAFTAIDIPYWSMPSAMTTDPVKRTKIFSYSNLGTSMASTVAGMLIVPLLNAFGGANTKSGFFGTAIVMAVIGITLYLTGFKLTREHVEASTEKFNYKKAAKALGTNKPLLIVIFMITPYSQVWLIMILSAAQVTLITLSMVIVSSMIADTIEYAEWKTGQRNEGVISSTRTFTTKLAMAFSGLIAGGILTFAGYVPNVEQSQMTLTVFHLVSSIVPGVIALVACIPMKWYDLTEERHAQIMKEIAERKANK